MEKVPNANSIGNIMNYEVCVTTHVISVTDKYVENSESTYWQAARWGLRYFKGTDYKCRTSVL